MLGGEAPCLEQLLAGSNQPIAGELKAQHGGAVARALMAAGHRVRGMTRNVGSDAARALGTAGTELVVGDFARPGSLTEATSGVDAVFAMSTPFEGGEAAEIAQGISLVDAAQEAGVGHFIYSSVASADKKTGIPHFDSEREIERYLASTSLEWTVIAPVYFMENLFLPQTLDALRAGTCAIAMPADVPLQQIAVADIGAFGALVVDQKNDFVGRRVDIAGDMLTAAESAEALSRILDRPIGQYEVPMDQVRAISEDFALMYEWFVDTGYSADVDGLRAAYPSVGWQRFADWAGPRAGQIAGDPVGS